MRRQPNEFVEFGFGKPFKREWMATRLTAKPGDASSERLAVPWGSMHQDHRHPDGFNAATVEEAQQKVPDDFQLFLFGPMQVVDHQDEGLSSGQQHGRLDQRLHEFAP